MTEATVHFTENNLAQTLADLLRSRTSSAKDLAKRIDCDPRAAESYRAGRNLPPLPVFIRMVKALGHDLGDAIINPETTTARLAAELREHEQRAEARRAALRAVAGTEGVRRAAQGKTPAVADQHPSGVDEP